MEYRGTPGKCGEYFFPKWEPGKFGKKSGRFGRFLRRNRSAKIFNGFVPEKVCKFAMGGKST